MNLQKAAQFIKPHIGLLIALIISLPTSRSSATDNLVPTGYNSWHDAGSVSRRAIEFGAEPANYWDGSRWIANDRRFEPAPSGWKSVKNRHYVHVDTISGTVRFAMADAQGNVHVLKTRVGPLYLFNRSNGDTVRIASPDLRVYQAEGDTIRIVNVYPDVDCLITNRGGGLDHRFIFGPTADSLIDSFWRDAGSGTGIFTFNSFQLLADSLNLEASDCNGGFSLSNTREIDGDIMFACQGQEIFRMPGGRVWQDTLEAPLYRRIGRIGNRVYLFEGFRNADVSLWPQKGYQHSDSRYWDAPGIDTYISGGNPGTNYYSSTGLIIAKSPTAMTERGLIWFRYLMDSLSQAGTIDSALFEAHYFGGVIGNGTARLERGIADSTWYNAQKATWNARYRTLTDSLQWAGGWAVHTSSFTTSNSVTRNLSDTTSTGWYQFSCRDLIIDIKNAGTDWGFWLDAGTSSTTQRTAFDSADHADSWPRLYVQYSTGASLSRRARLLQTMGE